MNDRQISKDLLAFIQNSPSMFHVTDSISKMLEEAGFTQIKEGEVWNLKQGGKYFTTRNGSSIIAFHIGETLDHYHFHLTASHSDSPTYKIKDVSELNGPKEYMRLDVEGYGGMIDSTWLDRPLSIAGRVLVKENNKILSKRLYIDKDILLIPNVAIHLNHDINKGYSYNRAVDLCPLFSAGELQKGDFDQMIAEELGVQKEDILGKDLFLVNRERGTIWGYKDEFISSPKLDDLQCVYASLKAFIMSHNEHLVNVFCCFDNEEVGSNTKQGAMSTFLYDTLHRVHQNLGKTEEEFHAAIARSMMVSCDNAHALHPNHPEKHDAVNVSMINGGIVIKESANQKYTTDAFSRAIFKQICREANVPVQIFANRSDLAGGSTLGNLSNIQVSMHAVDIGLPQLAMHSSYETAGVKDTAYAIKALCAFYNATFDIDELSGTGIVIHGVENQDS